MDVMQYDDAFISVYECMPGWLGLAWLGGLPALLRD